MELSISVLVAILVSLLLIGFFAGVEIAFVSANKLSLELNKKQGSYTGKIWGSYAEQPAKFIGTILVVINSLLVVYGLLIGVILKPFWNFIFPNATFKYASFVQLFFETIVATTLIIFIEFTSKAFFRARNNSILSSGFITYIVQFIYSLFSSVASIFVSTAEWILKYIFNVKIHAKKEIFTKIDLEHFIQQSNDRDAEENGELNNELFENVLSLSDIKVRTCLIPRKEIEAININTSIDEIRDRFIETKLSKLVVYENNIDTILGYIHQLDMFKNPESLRSILLPIPTIPESMNVSDLISKFSKERKSIAWVIDEFGGTAGIITMEDLLEEIFGEIKDEYDSAEEFVEKQIAANEYIFSGRLELDYITDKYKLRFRTNDETGTLSGYIISQHEDIPKQKERIIIDDYEFDILNVSETRIETVKIKVLR